MLCRFAVLLLACALAGPAVAAPQRNLDPELKWLIDQVADALDKDVALKGKTVKLGAFSSRITHPDSQYGPELRRAFEQVLKPVLKDRLVPVGALTVVVEYELTNSKDGTVPDPDDARKKRPMLVLEIKVQIYEGTKGLFEKGKSVEVNDTADIARVLGLSLSPPAGSQEARNDALRKAVDQNTGKKPDDVTRTFQVKDGTKIGCAGDDKFFVEILVKDTPDGAATAIEPTANERGDAFVDLKPGQFYEVVVHNADKHDCIAKITVDGQDAVNRFNTDGVRYDGLAVTPGRSGLLKGWLHTTKPREKEKDNVFTFAVKEYYPGAANDKVPTPAAVGVITVQFALAWEKGKPQPKPAGRHVGNFTDKGKPVRQDFVVKEYEHGEFNETISIRYSRTAK